MAPLRERILYARTEERTDVTAKVNSKKPYRKKTNGPIRRGNRGLTEVVATLNTHKLLLILLITQSVNVTTANVNNKSNFKKSNEISFKVRNLLSSISPKDYNVITAESSTREIEDSGGIPLPVKVLEPGNRKESETSAIGFETEASRFSIGEIEGTRTFKTYEREAWRKFGNQTFVHGFQKKKKRRKKRFVRFPAGEGGRFSGKYYSRPFYSSPPTSGGPYNSGFPPWSSVSRPGPFYSHIPTMRPRSPRLVFRDPVEPGTLTAPSSFFGNGLDTGFDDDREERGGKGIYSSVEDQGVCPKGRCEFFLSCWMSSGLIDGSCGGFLYACCQRLDKEAPKTNEHHVSDAITLPTNFGPVINDFRCGVSIGKIGAQRRIVGGDEAGFGSFPWQAYIRIGSSRCGGSLVNRFHVVTAGHCVARASARQVQVTLGDYVINSAVEPLPAYTFGVREIRVHPYFKFTPQADRFDVAVLRLDRPVQYMPHIAPICLPEKNEDFLGQYGWAAGWGALQAGSRLRPKTLQAVDVPVIDNRLCERWHKSNGINVVIYDEMMCAGYRNGGKDSCQGDSGGPLMLEKANRWYLIGIVSAGYSCAQRGQPGIYHRVAHTVDWISYIINS